MLCLLLTLLAAPVSYAIFDDWGRASLRRRKAAPVPDARVEIPKRPKGNGVEQKAMGSHL